MTEGNTKPPTLLIVDDDPSFAKILKRMAERQKAIVSVCKSLDELGTLQAKVFDIAIVDFDLGTANGLEVTDYLARFSPGCSVILVSQVDNFFPQFYTWPDTIECFIPKSAGHQEILEAAFTSQKEKSANQGYAANHGHINVAR